MADLGFDTADVAPDTGGSPLPPGTYQFQVVEAEVKKASTGRGSFINLAYEVIAPEEFSRRKVFDRMTVSHESAQAQAIGRGQLSALAAAIGIPSVTDSEQLMYGAFNAETKIEAEKKEGRLTGREFAVVKKYIPLDNVAPPAAKTPASRPAPAAAARAPARPGAAAPAGGRVLPWGQRPAAAPAPVDDDIPF